MAGFLLIVLVAAVLIWLFLPRDAGFADDEVVDGECPWCGPAGWCTGVCLDVVHVNDDEADACNCLACRGVF